MRVRNKNHLLLCNNIKKKGSIPLKAHGLDMPK